MNIFARSCGTPRPSARHRRDAFDKTKQRDFTECRVRVDVLTVHRVEVHASTSLTPGCLKRCTQREIPSELSG